MSKPKPPEQLFTDISQFVVESRELLKSGAMMELAGLDQRIAALCEQVLKLSQEDRLHYADKLQKLLAELKALGEEMVAQRDHMAEEIKAISAHKKANVAYKVSDSRDNFGKRGDDESE